MQQGTVSDGAGRGVLDAQRRAGHVRGARQQSQHALQTFGTVLKAFPWGCQGRESVPNPVPRGLFCKTGAVVPLAFRLSEHPLSFSLHSDARAHRCACSDGVTAPATRGCAVGGSAAPRRLPHGLRQVNPSCEQQRRGL